MKSLRILSLFLFSLCACGEETPADETPLPLPDAMDDRVSGNRCLTPEQDIVASGYVYVDRDLSERSMYTSGRGEDDPGIEPSMTVLGASSQTYELSECSDGKYELAGLADGVYLITPTQNERQCSTNNCSSSFARAVEENRRAVMVTFGDSLAVYGEAPVFPDRFATLVGDLVQIDNRNVAIAGSTSEDWLPDGNYFQSRLTPHIPNADLIVITIGGNDLMTLFSDAASLLADIPAAVEEARRIIQQVIENLKLMISAIREINPDVDIAFCLYPDYTQARVPFGKRSIRLWEKVNSHYARRAREDFTDGHNLMLVDIFGAAQD